MADKRISQLVDRGTVANNDVVPIVVSGAVTTNKATISSIQTYMQGNLDLGVTSVGITIGTSGTNINVTGSPVTSSGNITINIPTASSVNRGLLNSADWNTFNSKLDSVGLIMPSAFTVTNSPLTSNGSISVAGAGTVGQYIRGDGSLADFPQGGGGGASVSYYLNGSVSQGTIGGVAYREINKVPVFGAGTDIAISSNGYVASFITDANDPSLLEIPAGNWNFETYFSASSGGGSPTFYIELYKVNSGGTATLIASNSGTPESISLGTNINPYFSALAVPTTSLTLTDRLAIRIYVTPAGRTITLHTENGHLCQVITTFTTGLTALNGLTAQVQNFATGTSGSDFNISSASTTHTLNLPTASATNRGALSSADWTTFNNKQPAGNYVTLDTVQTITAQKTFTTSGGSDSVIITTTGAGFALDAIKAGNGEVIRVNKTSGTGNAMTVIGGNFEAPTIVKTGGTSSQFLKADGSVDSNTYLTTGTAASTYITIATPTTITGVKTFDTGTLILGAAGTANSTHLRNSAGDSTSVSGSNALGFNSSNKIYVTTQSRGGFILGFNNSVSNREYTLPDASGTLALTSNLSAYLPLTGGTLTGGLNGTSASFTGALTANGQVTFYQPLTNTSSYLIVENNRSRNSAIRLKTTLGDYYLGTGIGADVNQFQIFDGNAGENRLTISSTGAATFTNSVSARGLVVDGANNANISQLAMTRTDSSWGIFNETDLRIYNSLSNTITPTSLRFTLSTAGAATFSSSVTATQGIFKSTSGNQLRIAYDDSYYWNLQRIAADGRLSFSDSVNGEKLVLTTAGNVGIGTASPVGYGTTLQIAAGSGIDTSFVLGDGVGTTTNRYFAARPGSSGNFIFGTDVGDISFRTGLNPGTSVGTERMRITSGGNVGIGTNNPTTYSLAGRHLEVNDAGGGFAFIHNNTTSVKSFYAVNNSEGSAGLYTFSDHFLKFGTNNSEKVRITSDGYFKASNTGSYQGVSNRFHELRTNLADEWAAIIGNSSSSPYGIQIRYAGASPNGGANQFLVCSDSTVDRLRIASNGNVTNTNGAYGSISDAKLKENITDASPKLEDLLKVKVRNYNLIGEETKQIGVIAQELEEVFPAMIDESEDFEEVEVPVLDEEGNEVLNEEGEVVSTKEKQPTGTTTKSVKYSVFVPMLIKAIQEQQEIINEMRAEIDSLKTK